MATGLSKHHILEAIDKLRSRKSRPDVLRIVSYVSKKYEFPKNDIKEYLEMLSEDGTVLKVEFKGSISYRNAARYRNFMPKTLSGVSEVSCDTQEPISDLVAEALAQLIVQEPDYLDVGISMNELYNHIDARYKKTLTKQYFKEILHKEVKNGNLVKYENGNYCLGYRNGEQSSLSSNASETSQISNDKIKEKSNSPITTVRKYSSLSRHSSPGLTKGNSATPTLVVSEKSCKSQKSAPPVAAAVTAPRSYPKAARRPQDKSQLYERKEDVCEKNELSPVREGSRRKRFQKIVFDPSDSPKPKRGKDKEIVVLIQNNKRIRGAQLRKGTKESEISPEKNIKKDGSLPVSKQQQQYQQQQQQQQQQNKTSVSAAVNVKAEEHPDVKAEALSDNDSDENDAGSDDGNCCKICLFTIDFKSTRASERWIVCQVCDKKAHVSCVEDTEHWTNFKLSKWQCNDCKSCVACKGNKNSNEVGLILCGLCDDAYHIKCANIKKSKTTQKWFCPKCSGVFSDGVKSEKEDFESTGITSNDSSQRTSPEPEEKKMPEKETSTTKAKPESDDIDETIPDCSNWTCEDVYTYFLKYVLPEEADVFRDQEIDGRVLLLLTRYDVLSDFKLKLGPALKIYAQVKRLQVRKNDPCLFWP